MAKIFLETTIFNFYYADDAPDKRDATITLFEEIKNGVYEPFTSLYVIEELLEANEPKQSNMIKLIRNYSVEVLAYSDEAERLADRYIKEGIIPADHRSDAIHIATTTVNGLDFIISYNFRHIVKEKTIRMVEAINILENYRKIGVYTSEEIINYET